MDTLHVISNMLSLFGYTTIFYIVPLALNTIFILAIVPFTMSFIGLTTHVHHIGEPEEELEGLLCTLSVMANSSIVLGLPVLGFESSFLARLIGGALFAWSVVILVGLIAKVMGVQAEKIGPAKDVLAEIEGMEAKA